jgi:hypothetical protein
LIGCSYQTREQRRLVADDLGAQRRELIVATPSIVWSTRVCGLRVGNQLISHQSGKGPIQRAWAQPNPSAGELINKPHNGVPVAMTGRQRQQDLEARGRQAR